MTSDTTTRLPPQAEIEAPEHLLDNWFDPIEAGLRGRVREFLQALLEAELDEALGRSRYGRRTQLANDTTAEPQCVGHRHGHRSRSLLGTFGRVELAVPRAVRADDFCLSWAFISSSMPSRRPSSPPRSGRSC